MNRRQKGQKRNYGSGKNNANFEMLSDQELILQQLREASENVPQNLETFAENSITDIDATVADFENIPEGVEQAADDKEKETIAKLNNEAISAGETAKKNIDSITHNEAADTTKEAETIIHPTTTMETKQPNNFPEDLPENPSTQPDMPDITNPENQALVDSETPAPVQEIPSEPTPDIDAEQHDAPSEPNSVENPAEEETKLTIRRLESLLNSTAIVKTGEHLMVNKANGTMIMVEENAQLTIEEATDCKIAKYPTSKVEIKLGTGNETVNLDTKSTTPEDNTEKKPDTSTDDTLREPVEKADTTPETPEISQPTSPENRAEEEQGFEQFFANLKLADFEDMDSLKEKFFQMILEDEKFLQQMDVKQHYIGQLDSLKERYFESFVSQAEAVLKEQIYIAKSQKEGTKTKTLKEEGKKFVKGIFAGGSYTAIRLGITSALKIGTEAAMPVKIAIGGLAGAGVSAFNYLLGRGYNKLNAKTLKKLAQQATKMEDDGLDQGTIFSQLQADMNALAQFDAQQQEDLKQQKSAAYEISNADLEEYFTGESTDDKKAKLEDLQKLVRLTGEAKQSEGLYKQEKIQERQELIKSLIDSGTLEDFANYQIAKAVEQLSARQELDEETKNSIALEAQLAVDRQMNVLLGDIVAQEKIAELDKLDKKSFKDSYVAKLFGNTPPESLLQAVTKGFVSGLGAGAVYTSAISGAIYTAQQRLYGTVRSEVLKKSASEIKTSRDIGQEFDNFQLNSDNLTEAENMILDARARIKLPDIKEVERAKLELKIQTLQNQMIRLVQLEKINGDNLEDTKNLAKKIIAQRSQSIEKAIDITKKEKARKSIKGLWKSFYGLSRQEKLKILAKAGWEGVKGGAAGAIGAELVNAGAAAYSGEDYDLGQSLDNIKDRVTLGVGGAIESVKEIWSGDDSDKETVVDTSAMPKVEIPKPIFDDDFDIEDLAVNAEDFDIEEDTTGGETTSELPINIFETGVSIEDLSKVVCELDNDPNSPEADYAKKALDQLFTDKSLDIDKYTEEITKHIAQELHLGNQQTVENVITNSGLNIAAVIETVDRVNLEKEFGINTSENELSQEQLAKLAEGLNGDKSAEASALLEYLEKAKLISYEQKFAIEHPSAEHAGLKAEKAEAENQATHKLSLELGKDGAPKHLEQVFYRLGIDGMKFGEEITNVEASQILNVGANLRVLSEGHDIAGINALDFQKYISVEDGKVTITNYEGFQENIINPLIEHSREIITAENVADSGAVAYIDNIKDSTWGDMLSPEKITEEQINFDQKQIDAAEQRLFQATLSSTELGELATDIESTSEESGTFVLANEKIAVENNLVTQIGNTPLEEPIHLDDKEAGDKLIDKTSELKQERFLTFVEENKQQMIERLNEQLADHQLFKQEIIPPILETPQLEYDVTTQLNVTLDKLGFGDSHGQKDWIELKGKSVDDLLKGEIREHEARFTSRYMERHHEAHMREFIQQAINDGKLEPPSSGGPSTVEEAMKELMIQQTRESLQHDIARAEQKVIASEKLEEKSITGSETLGDQIRGAIDNANKDTATNSIPQWLAPEHKTELDEMMPDGWTEQDIPQYMRPDEGRVNFDDKVETAPENAVEAPTLSLRELYNANHGTDLNLNDLDKMSTDQLKTLKEEIEFINSAFKQGPTEDIAEDTAMIEQADIDNVLKEANIALLQINERLSSEDDSTSDEDKTSEKTNEAELTVEDRLGNVRGRLLEVVPNTLEIDPAKIDDNWLLDNVDKVFRDGDNLYVVKEGISQDMQTAVDKASLRASSDLVKTINHANNVDSNDGVLKMSQTMNQAIFKTPEGNYKALIVMKTNLADNVK